MIAGTALCRNIEFMVSSTFVYDHAAILFCELSPTAEQVAIYIFDLVFFPCMLHFLSAQIEQTFLLMNIFAANNMQI